jgi:hypothetical protein
MIKSYIIFTQRIRKMSTCVLKGMNFLGVGIAYKLHYYKRESFSVEALHHFFL